MRILGIILISIGLLTLALPYLTFTKREKILDVGPVEAVAETKERVPVSSALGAIILVAGAGIVIASVMKKLGVSSVEGIGPSSTPTLKNRRAGQRVIAPRRAFDTPALIAASEPLLQ